MSFHIELRCDRRLIGRIPGRGPSPIGAHGCATRRGLDPHRAARNQTGAGQAIPLLVAEALDAGWQRSADGWLCPFCALGGLARALSKGSAPARGARPRPPRSAGG